MAIRTMPEASYLRECFDYDPGTGILRWKERPASHFKSEAATHQINSHFAGTQAGWPHDKSGRLYVELDQRPWAIARIIWKIMTGVEPPRLVDHRDKNAANDKWDNLRPASYTENACNQRGRRNGKKGAYPDRNRWRSVVTVNGRRFDLGTFDTEEQAHTAYVDAALRLHGDFACTEGLHD